MLLIVLLYVVANLVSNVFVFFRLLGIIESMQIEDIKINMALSKYGADHILSQLPDQNVTVLTHCNTGSLATGGYGTALGGSVVLKKI